MARPAKKGLDYFSHDTNASASREMEYLESLYGLTGYAIYLKILERVYGHEGYYLPWTEIDSAIFAKHCGIERDELDKIVETCLEINLFSRWVYDANLVLTSQSIQRRFQQASTRMVRNEIKPEYNLLKVVSATETQVKEENKELLHAETPQKKRKEKKRKETKEVVLTPQQQRVFDCCQNMKGKILERFPHAESSFDIEVDKCVAFNCHKNVGADPSLAVWRWFEKIKKPRYESGKKNFMQQYGGKS